MSNTVVVKVGTGVLTRLEDGRLDGGSLLRLVSALAELKATGRQVVLVSSGAVGGGVSALGLKKYPETVPERQAAAAVGQARLMHIYENLFSQFELSVAQVLLTGTNLKDDETRQRLFEMMSCLFEREDVVPIVNQNDSLDIEELSQGDNDLLSVRVAELIQADLLVLLTSADGLCRGEGGELVPEITSWDEAFELAGQGSGKFSIGGMRSKLSAVEKGFAAGVEVVIGNGRKPERLKEIVEGGGICTRFLIEK